MITRVPRADAGRHGYQEDGTTRECHIIGMDAADHFLLHLQHI